MGELKIGYFSRPDYDQHYLLETVGYVKAIWVEQENNYDQIWFLLQIYERDMGTREAGEPVEVPFSIYMDRNTTAAFAMMQLLRDALASMASKGPCWLVHVHFTFRDEDLDSGHAYQIKVISDLTEAYPVTVQGYYDTPVQSWWTHLD